MNEGYQIGHEDYDDDEVFWCLSGVLGLVLCVRTCGDGVGFDQRGFDKLEWRSTTNKHRPPSEFPCR